MLSLRMTLLREFSLVDLNVLAFRFNLTRYTRNSWTYGWITTGSLKDMIEQFVQALYGGMELYQQPWISES